MTFRLLATLFALLMLTACKSGSSSSDSPPPETPAPGQQPENASISGRVMLGAVQNITVRITGPNNEFLIETTTDEAGRFGPADLPADYKGPVLIEALANDTTRYFCDNFFACLDINGTQYEFGQRVPFTGRMALYLPNTQSLDQPVTLSPFSTAAAARTDLLGISSETISDAHHELQQMLAGILQNLDQTLPGDYFSHQFSDFINLYHPSTYANEDLAALYLTLLSSSLFQTGDSVSGSELISAESALEKLVRSYANTGKLPAYSPSLDTLSIETFALAVASHMAYLRYLAEYSYHPLAQGIRHVIGLKTLLDFNSAVIDTLPDTGRIATETSGEGLYSHSSFTVDDATLSRTLEYSIPLLVSPNVEASRLTILGDSEKFALNIVSRNDALFLDVSFDSTKLSNAVYGQLTRSIRIADTDGQLRSLVLTLSLTSHLYGLQLDTEIPPSVRERDTVQLSASTNRPLLHTSYEWNQIDGPTITLQNRNSATPTFVAPNIEHDFTARFQLVATDELGHQATQKINIPIRAYHNLNNVPLTDKGLIACLDDTEANNNWLDAGSVLELSCASHPIHSVQGMDAFSNLQNLDVSGGGYLSSLEDLYPLPNLTTLNVSNQPLILCKDLLALKENAPTLEITGGEGCNREIFTQLFGNPHDMETDAGRSRIYVSIPENRQLAVVDMQSFQVLQFIDFPGAPRGISLSLDKNTLFVAVSGANSVASLDLDSLEYTLISLGSEPGGTGTNDVLEVEPGRLLVTTNNPSTSAYVVQLLLNEGNAVSRVADDRLIRANPVVISNNARTFAYVGEGFSPNSIYQLDLTDPAARIVAEDNHGSVSGADELVINHDDTLLLTKSGQVLDIGSFTAMLTFSGNGTFAASATKNVFYQASADYWYENGGFRVYTTESEQPLSTTPVSCANRSIPAKLRVLDGAQSDMIWLVEEAICGFATRQPELLNSTPLMAVRDPILQSCINNTISTQEATLPWHLTALDCTGFAGITSLDGLRAFNELRNVTLDDGEFFDLAPLGSLHNLEFVSLRNNPRIADISPLIRDWQPATSVDLRGSDNIPCAQIDSARAKGTSVASNHCASVKRIALGGAGADLAIDEARNRIYVSIPALGQIKVVDAVNYEVVDTIEVSGTPTGLDLSIDGTQLIAGYSDSGTVALINLATDTETLINVSSQLATNNIFDVAEVLPGRIIVTGEYTNEDTAFVVAIDTGLIPVVRRVADGRPLRTHPRIVTDRENGFAYLGGGGSLRTLWQIDANQTSAPITREEEMGVVRETHVLQISEDGSEILDGHGQKLATSDFIVRGTTGSPGIPALSPAGSLAVLKFDGYYYDEFDDVEFYDYDTLTRSGHHYVRCGLRRDSKNDIRFVGSTLGFTILSGGLLCQLPNPPL